MGRSVDVLEHADAAAALAESWDRLPAERGIQADFYDGHSWFEAWRRVAGPDRSARVRIPLVLEDDQVVGLLPMEAFTPRRWESLGRELRTRYRPVVRSERPDPQILELLVDVVGRSGASDITLHRLPARDPATASLIQALGEAGFHATRRERSSDCIAPVLNGWEEHRHRFASYERAVKARVTKIRKLWDLSLEEHGPGTDLPVLQGFEIYAELHSRSWKGTLSAPLREHRTELLRRTAELGWPRVYVLRVGGVAVAAHLWFRLGGVATWLSTVHDQRVAALSPGTIVMWWSQERIFEEGTPRLLDLLPGATPQKDTLAPERPPLVIVEAVRRTLVGGITFPVRRRLRRFVPAAMERVRRRIRGSPSRTEAGSSARAVEFGPRGSDLPVEPLRLDPATVRYLAVAGGHPGPEAMSRTWEAGDTWWRVGDGPAALVRMGGENESGARPVREVVLVTPGGQVEPFLQALADHLEVPVFADLPAASNAGRRGTPIPVHQPVLPWPTGLGEGSQSGAGGDTR